MVVGIVVGNVVSSRKEESLVGYKLLIVKIIDEMGGSKNIVAIDRVGAGINSEVIVSTGSSARIGLRKEAPVDAAIIGIVD